MSEHKQEPVERFRVGDVQVSIWENATAGGPFYNVTAQRSYVDSDGVRQYTQNFNATDLWALIVAMKSASAWIEHEYERRARGRSLGHSQKEAAA